MKDSIIRRFWGKYVGRYNISESYIFFCNIIALIIGAVLLLFFWWAVLTFMIIK